MIELVSDRSAAAAAERILASPRVALDTEFHAENRYLPDLYLVQIGLEDGSTLLVDPLVPGALATVAPALLARQWVLHAGEHDLRLLTQALGEPPSLPVFDTQIAVGLVSAAWPAGYAATCETWLGVAVDKSETLSDWSRRPLSQAQQAYAARDVQHLFPLADRLQRELDTLGRASIASAAMAQAVTTALEPSPTRWLRDVAVGTTLEPRQANVLRALLTWRDDRARGGNVPPRVVAGDGILVDLARRMPRTEAEMTASRRFPKNVARWAPELRAVMEAAAQTPEDTWPHLVRRNTVEARRSAFLQLWSQILGEHHRWGAGLALPRDLADQVALGNQAELGWRADLIGPALADALAGTTTLSLGRSDVELR